MSRAQPRDTLAGPDDGPEIPYPIHYGGPIIRGFGRGSQDLGIPTANIPVEGLVIGGYEDLRSGIYFGWAALGSRDVGNVRYDRSLPIYPMVMSIGWNPFYKNTVRSLEVHLIHQFDRDFYGHHMNLSILGYIRPEHDYISKALLIADIRVDIQVALNSLARPAYDKWRSDEYLQQYSETPTITS